MRSARRRLTPRSERPTREALRISGTDMVTVAIRRVHLDPSKGASLLDFYLDNRVHFWGLFAAYLICVTANMWLGGWRAGWSIGQYFTFGSANLIWISLCLILAWTRRMVVHWIIVAIN